MGDGKVVGETGPDVAGKNLSPTTVKVCFLRDFHLYFSSDAIHKSTQYQRFFLNDFFLMKGIHHETHVQPAEVFFRS